MAPFRPTRVVHAIAALLACVPPVGCKHCDLEADEEEQDLERDHYWRAQIAIVGQGTVKTVVRAFDCTSDGASLRGDCGPKLVTFKELQPPLMEERPAPGWRFDHWESRIREPDGATAPRKGPMPDGRFYLNGFGYRDTGELETVTCVFVPDAPGGEGDARAEPR